MRTLNYEGNPPSVLNDILLLFFRMVIKCVITDKIKCNLQLVKMTINA